MKFSIVSLVAMASMLSSAAAFVPHSSGGVYRPALFTSKPSSLQVMTPDHMDAMSSAMDSMNHVMSTTGAFLADASAAVAEDATDDIGWWQKYLNLFESTLIYIHSSIDGPLQSVGITQTWGISIAIFTAGIRGLLVPLSIQQSKSTEYQKALKPYMTEIKEKFKDNKDMQNRATAKLYEDANQNPLAGCFVSLAQLPIFLGLYRGVRLLAQDGLLKEGFLWIPSLEGPVSPPTYRGLEWLTENWVSTGAFPPTPSLGWATTIAYCIMPIVLVLGQSLTMSILSPPPDEDSSMSDEEKETLERSQLVLKFLPLLIGFFSLQVPAGLTIYWLVSNTFTLSQSLAVKAYFAANPPDIELPEYWDALDDVANMSAEDRRKAAEAGISTGPKFADLLDEAKFHYVVERTPLREHSAAWERAQEKPVIPEAMAVWVSKTAHSSSSEEMPASVETSTESVSS